MGALDIKTYFNIASFRIMTETKLGLFLSDEQLAQLAAYTALLLDWNERINLTAITEPADIMIKHHFDSLIFGKWIEHYYPHMRIRLADMGTGAGFPGIPLKIAMPQLNLVLIDSLAKRINFLEQVIERLGLTEIDTCHARAEDIGREPGHRAGYDIVVARAVAGLPVLLEYCTPLLKTGGLFIAAKGPQPEKEVEAARNALDLLQCRLEQITQYELPGGVGRRSLIMITKTGETPLQYPRQPGKPKKNPL